MVKFTLILLVAGSALILFSDLLHGGAISDKLLPTSGLVERSLDQPRAAFQDELLDLAFQTAATIPVKPHIKDRCRAQEEVVRACLDLDRTRLALAYTKEILNWRRGTAYADLAFYLAQQGQVSEEQISLTDDVRHYLNLAEQVVHDAQDWRRDRIRVRIAQTHAWLGHDQEAQRFQAGVGPSEWGKVARVRAMICDPDVFDELMRAVEEEMSSGHFDVLKNALSVYAKLFNRFYADPVRRALVEEKIRAFWNDIPIFIRVNLIVELTRYALNHADLESALAWLDEGQSLLDGAQWPLEYRLPAAAQVIKMRYQAGDRIQARSEADEMLALFNTNADQIIDIYRAGALLPLAEAYAAMSDTPTALAVYQRALEEGTKNPNSRPQALDLSAVCLSMARCQVKPNAELWGRMRQIHDGLGEPW